MTELSETSGTDFDLRTSDDERLAARYFPPADLSSTEGGASRFAVVLAPGFSGHANKPAVRAVLDDLRRCLPQAGFLVVDLRGHGRSSGYSTLGDREALDIDVAVAEVRRRGYQRVVSLGWSMGATCVLRHAALVGEAVHGFPLTCAPDAVVTVSAVSRWEVRDTVPMRRLHKMIETRIGRLVARRLLKVRIDPAGKWPHTPLSPVEAVARISVPLLLVHGENDHYFGWEHAEALADAAGPAAGLWLVSGLGHAEEAAARPDVPALLSALARAIGEMAEGRPAPAWPDGADVDGHNPSAGDTPAGNSGQRPQP